MQVQPEDERGGLLGGLQQQARRHWLSAWSAGDWVATVAIFWLAKTVDHQLPFERRIGPQLHDTSISYPHTAGADAICPGYLLYTIALDVPLAVLAVLALLLPPAQAARGPLRLRLQLLSQLWIGLLSSLACAMLLTNAIKVSVGRLRPDFIARCIPVSAADSVLCTGAYADVREGRKSFPSGHTTVAFAGLFYLSLVLAGRLAAVSTPRAGSLWKAVVVAAPWFVALLIGLSRIADYWHHWQDVLIGGLIGHAAALGAHRLRFANLAAVWPCALRAAPGYSELPQYAKHSPPEELGTSNHGEEVPVLSI